MDQFALVPQSWNLYAYVRNSPLTATDPTGRCSKTADGFTDKGKGLFPGPCSDGTIGDPNHSGANSVTVSSNEGIANTAVSQVGSYNWLQMNRTDNFPCGSNKCNKGVADWIAMSGTPRPLVPKWFFWQREPTAHEWVDPNVDIPGWSKPKALVNAQPGDVIAQAHGDYGHVGIVVSVGQTVSVNSTTEPAGIVTLNSWGFRTGPGANGEGPNDKPPVVRTYIGDR